MTIPSDWRRPNPLLAALDDPTRDAIVMAVARWFSIREAESYRWKPCREPGDNNQLAADVWHSDLLRRLLRGEAPLEDPPGVVRV